VPAQAIVHGGRFLDTYWTPVAGEKGFYVHYANDITDCVRKDAVHGRGGRRLLSHPPFRQRPFQGDARPRWELFSHVLRRSFL